MKKKLLFLSGALLALVAACVCVLLAFGRTYTLRLDESNASFVPETAENVTVVFRVKDPGAELTEIRAEEGALLLRLSGLRPGKTPIEVFSGGEPIVYATLYVYPGGVITAENLFGDCTCDFVFPLAVLLFLAAVLFVLILDYRAGVRQSMYQYRNVLRLGLIVFLCFLALDMLPVLFGTRGLLHVVENMLNVFHAFSRLVLPAAFVLAILLTVSNIGLMRREGKTIRNMLGILLGAGLLVLTLLPFAAGEWLQRMDMNVIDVHNQRGAALYVETFTEAAVSALVTYLECVLFGTVYFALKAARHIPAFDKDYILILGCQLMPDGSLTPLLRSRADRAVEFARMQKEKTGKELVFVPSGGQGPDEALPEAAAVGTYLESTGIPRARILTEEASVNTYENIRNSMALIREHAGGGSPKVAFSTTNYHVFRAGLLARAQGEALEGIGSPTKRYFWVNAFIREFMATLVSERKGHVLVFLLVTAAIAAMVIIKYLSVVI